LNDLEQQEDETDTEYDGDDNTVVYGNAANIEQNEELSEHVKTVEHGVCLSSGGASMAH
jgi:hypothetical protein